MYGNTATAVADITALASENKFVMASSVEQKTIQDNISKETVKTGTEEAQNVFSFDMERVVSQGMVAKGDNLNTETTDGRGSVDLDDLTYTAINLSLIHISQMDTRQGNGAIGLCNPRYAIGLARDSTVGFSGCMRMEAR